MATKLGAECPKKLIERIKQQWAIEKRKLDKALKTRGIFFMNPEDKELQGTTKKHGKVGTSNGRSHAVYAEEPREIFRNAFETFILWGIGMDLCTQIAVTQTS